MDSRLHIANSQIVFSFRRNQEIRKRVFEFEDSLKAEFKAPFRTIAVPDDIDPNIPRFESQSINGHSRIQVSQTRITLATNYNENFKLDYKHVEDYLANKSSSITKLTESENMDFVAYVIELGVFMDEKKLNSFIKENTGAIAIDDDCRDFSLSYSKEYKSNYYLNIKCSKFAEQEMFLHPETKTLRPTGNLKHGISIILDINTRPYFEKTKSFDKGLCKEIQTDAFDIINSKSITDFLKGNI